MKKIKRTKSSGSITKKLQNDVQHIYKALYQGNGKPSLITQISNLENKILLEQENTNKQICTLHEEIRLKTADIVIFVNDKQKNMEENFKIKIENLDREIELKFKNITDVVSEKFNNITFLIRQEFDKRKEESAGLWNFKTAITTSVLASFTSVFVLLLAELIKRLS